MDLKGFMHDIISPGETIVMGGKRNGGKTATSLSIAQHAMMGDYGHENVLLVTNIIFGRVVKGSTPVQDYPPGVFHEDTLAGTMRRIGTIIDEYGSGNCTIIWLLDEAQNYMMADQNGSKENQALIKYLGNARKFDVCNFFLTPAINNLTPRVRCFPTGENKSGYCSVQMLKDPDKARDMLSGRENPRSITFVKPSAEDPFMPVFIRPTSWIKGIYERNLPVGHYGYDTKSTATFSVGENEHGVPFSFENFIKATSGGLSHELPGKISEFFDKWDSEGSGEDDDALPGTDLKAVREREQCRRINEMRWCGLTWKQISIIEGEPERSMGYRYDKWMELNGSPEPKMASISANGERGGGRVGAYIYNPKRGDGSGSPGSPVGGES